MVLAGLLFSLAGCAEEAGQPEAGVQQENPAVSEVFVRNGSRERLWRGDNGFG